MSCCGSKAGIETPAPPASGTVNNALFHSRPHINQTLRQIVYILQFCLVDLFLNYGPDFEVNWIENIVVQWAATYLESHRRDHADALRLFHFQSEGSH